MPDKPAFNFSTMAELYQRMAEPMTLGIAEQALALAEVSAGQDVIDVAAGPGGLAVAAARRGARVLATDVAPAMVARAADRLRGFAGCDARVMSCEALTVPDAGFDASFSLFGVVMVPQWRQGLAEIVRVTRRGGRVVLGAWTEHGRHTPIGVLKGVFDSVFPGRTFFPADPMDWGEARLTDALQAAGCGDVAVHTYRGELTARDAESLVSESEPFWRLAPGYADLSDRERAEIREPLIGAIRTAYGTADGSLHATIAAHVAQGTRS